MDEVSIRILLVDDHPLVIDGLRAALAEQAEIEIVAHASTLAEARSLRSTVECDVVMLDLRLPDGSGIELLREALDDPEPPAFLVLSSFQTDEYVSAAIALGANGFLLKTAPASEIVAAVRHIAEGGLAFTPEQLRASRHAAWAPLTEREHAILAGVIRGRSNDELAGDLGLARKTVEGYLSRLFARYGVITRTELAVHAERDQLLDLPYEPRRRWRR